MMVPAIDPKRTYGNSLNLMTELCQHLTTLHSQAIALGCRTGETTEGWSKVNVVIELLPSMPSALRNVTSSILKPIRYYASPRTPHNPADEGFICDECKVALSFPMP